MRCIVNFALLKLALSNPCQRLSSSVPLPLPLLYPYGQPLDVVEYRSLAAAYLLLPCL